MNQPTPTPGFEFPTSMQDKVDARLRATPTSGLPGSVRPGVKVGLRSQPEITQMKSSLDPLTHDPDDDSDVPNLPPPNQAWPQHQPTENLIEQVQPQQGKQLRSKQQIPPHIKATIPNPDPAMTPIVTDDMISLSLPSRFAFYSFKDLYIKPLRVSHLSKLAKANDIDSMHIVCEVVSSILATPQGDVNIGFKLCISDFQAVLYWLRANSFPKSTMRIKSQCQNHLHHEKVAKGQLDAASLTTESVHDISGLESIELERAPDPEVYRINMTLNGHQATVQLRPETMWDSIQFLADERYLDPEFQYMARLAAALDMDTAFPLDPITGQGIKAVPQFWTLDQKIRAVDAGVSVADVMLITEFNELVDSFGVNEIVDVKCKECGHVSQVRLAIDARTFPSPAF